MAKGEEKEALTLEKVLFTVLEASSRDLNELEEMRSKNNSGILSYFYTPANVTVAKPIRPSIRSSGSLT
jgi:hypothetical protein